MMRKYLKEYGLIVILVAVGITGYLLYLQNKEDILSYSLDLIGEQLISMVDDADSKERLATRFASFKERVLENEIAREQVENIAANVLNLSISGSKLTPMEAQLVLDMPFMTDITELPSSALDANVPEPADIESTSPPDARRPPRFRGNMDTRERRQLGERLQSIIALNTQVHEIAGKNREDAMVISGGVRYDFENGLQVTIDETLRDSFRKQLLEGFADEIKKLEDDKLLIWRQNLSEQLRRDRAKFRAEVRLTRAMERAQQEGDRTATEGLDVIVSLKHLEGLGYHSALNPESLHVIVGAPNKRDIAVHLDQLKTYWEEIALRLEGMGDEQITVPEDYWQHFEQNLELEIKALEQRLEREASRVQVETRVRGSASVSTQESSNG